MSDTEYTLAIQSWADPQNISVFDPDEQILMDVPLSFVRSGGVNNWTYIFRALECILEPYSGGRLFDSDGQEVDHNLPPSAGKYTLRVDGE